MKKGNTKMLIRNLREMEETKQCTLYGVGVSFLLELRSKYTERKNQLSKNLDWYKDKPMDADYDRCFSNWNNNNLFLWDIEDALCRMGIELE